MTHDEFEKLTSDMETVSVLLKCSAGSNRDATESMKFAQAALNASDAVNRKWMCLGANRPSRPSVDLSHLTKDAEERIRKVVNEYSDVREAL